MTTFYADVRIYKAHRLSTDDNLIAVEIPGPDIHAALAQLMAWKAGLAANPRFDTAMEESISAAKRRGVTYMTLREAASHLRNNVFS